MKDVIIASDTVANPSDDVVNEVPIIPLHVHFTDAIYREKFDLTSSQFYAKLKVASELPTTSQPSVGEFLAFYDELLQKARSIVLFTMSAKMSGTYQSATAAAELMPDADITVIDTQSVLAAGGLVVMEAVRAARAGKSKGEIVALAHRVIGQTEFLFTLDTLRYLYKGGRIGGASALVGSLLQVKPILAITGGLVQPVERVRTRPKSLHRLVEIMRTRVRPEEPVHVGVMQGECKTDGEYLMDAIHRSFNCREIYFSDIGPVIGVHTGPGTVGMSYWVEGRD
jgi:DegV family protein with EDD domain